MEFLAKAELDEWLRKRGLATKAGDLPVGDPVATWSIPVDAGRKTALAATLLRVLEGEPEAAFFIEEYGVFPSCEDRTLFDTFRRALGAKASISEQPAHVFNASEFRFAQSLVGMTLYFFWEGVLIAGSGRIVVRLSHDECLYLGGVEPEVGRAKAALQMFFDAGKRSHGA